MTPRSTTFVDRVGRRVRAERWILDAARRHPVTQAARRSVERQRARRLVAAEGSVDAALDRIVRDAIASAPQEES